MSAGVVAAHYVASTPATGYSAAVLADSPLAYWRMGDTSGTTMTDSSGNLRHGTYVNGPVLGTTGLLPADTDKAVDFDGTNDYAYTPSAAWMNVTSFSAEAIVVPDTVAGDRIIVSRQRWDVGPTSGFRSWHLMIQGGQFNVGLTMTDGTYIDAKVGPTVSAGTKYHVVLTWDGTTVSLYLNGTLAYSSTALSGKTLTSPSNDLVVAAESAYKSTGAFDGRIDEVAFYGTALSAARVSAHYAAISTYATQVLADSPLAYYRLGELAGTTMTDASGNARHGTYSGAYTLGATGLLSGDSDTSVDWLGGVGTVPLASWMQTTGLTIEAVIQTDTLASTDVIAARADWAAGFGPAYSWALYREADHFLVEVFSNNTSTRVGVSSGAILTTTRYHVAATYDGTTVRLYVNGASVGTPAALAAPLSPGASPLTVGRTPYAADGGFDGRIDEVAFYGTALSATRIAAHAAAI